MSAGTVYGKRYAGGFLDLPTTTTPIDSAFLNAVEVALLQLIGAAPNADGQVAQWDNANTRYGPALLLNKNIDPAAAIVKSKLDFTGANGITNADIAAAAAIARSKLDFGSGLVNADVATAAAIALTKLAKVPGYGAYRKTTAKTVNTTVAETDLLNGEITIAAGELGASGVLRLTARGDWKQNSGADADIPRLKLKLGGVVLIDTGSIGVAAAGNSATRFSWRADATIANLGATNSQWVDFKVEWVFGGAAVATSAASFILTGEGTITTIMSRSTPQTNKVEAMGANVGAVDTSVATALVLSVINASANANYETVLRHALVEIIG